MLRSDRGRGPEKREESARTTSLLSEGRGNESSELDEGFNESETTGPRFREAKVES
jgi:hypothetical protein